MNKLVLSLGLLSLVSAHLAQAECIVVPKPLTVETRCNLGDLGNDEQKQLMYDFIDQARLEVTKLKIPKKLTPDSDKMLDQAKADLNPIIATTNKYSQDYRRGRGAQYRDMIPTGFIAAVGMNASGNVGIGVGGSLLITIAAVPIRVKSIDLRTGAERFYTEWDMDVGGMLQVGGGIGGGAGVGFRGGVGMIWGNLPTASAAASILGSGFAPGVSGDTKFLAGLGITAMRISNKATGMKNLLAFAQFDMAVGVDIEAHGCAFYLLNAEELAKYLHVDELVAAGAPKS